MFTPGKQAALLVRTLQNTSASILLSPVASRFSSQVKPPTLVLNIVQSSQSTANTRPQGPRARAISKKRSHLPLRVQLRADLETVERENVKLHQALEKANSHAILQSLYLERLRKKLFYREQKKKSKVEYLKEKIGRHLTGNDFHGVLVEDKENHDSEERKAANRQRLATLRKEKADWRANEIALRKAVNQANRKDNDLEKEWCAEHPEDELVLKRMVKREATPERFAELKRPKKALDVVEKEFESDREGSWVSDDDDGEDSC
jgi:hypothetical protein